MRTMTFHGNARAPGQPTGETLLSDSALPSYSHEFITHFKGRLFGMLTLPHGSRGQGKLPGMILLGGSEGGVFTAMAEHFAGMGFATLTVAYLSDRNGLNTPHGATSCPKWSELPIVASMIPLESFQEPVEWLRKHRCVDGANVSLHGASYGGMLALALASQFPDLFKTVAAITPSSLVLSGVDRRLFGKKWEDYEPAEKERAAHLSKATIFSLGGKNYPANTYKVDNQHDPYRGRIPVEKIASPTFIVSGERDKAWVPEEFRRQPLPDCFNAESIGAALSQTQSGEHFFKNYPKNGHSFLPEHVALKMWQGRDGDASQESFDKIAAEFGGEDGPSVRDASNDAWQKYEHFLRDNGAL